MSEDIRIIPRFLVYNSEISGLSIYPTRNFYRCPNCKDEYYEDSLAFYDIDFGDGKYFFSSNYGYLCFDCHHLFLTLGDYENAKKYLANREKEKIKDLFESSQLSTEATIYTSDLSEDIICINEDCSQSIINHHPHKTEMTNVKLELKIKRFYGETKSLINKQAVWCNVCKRYYMPSLSLDFLRNNYPGSVFLFRYLIVNNWMHNKIDNFEDVICNGLSSKKIKTVLPSGKTITVVRRDLFSCFNRGHIISSFLADIPIVKNDGKNSYERVEVQYCHTDKKFFILEPIFLKKIYRNYESTQVLKTFIIQNKEWGLPSIIGDGFSPQSPLILAGYTVSKNKALSQSKRRRILDYVINYGVLSEEQVKSYISMFISLIGTQPQNNLAKNKWESDLEYIQGRTKKPYIGIIDGILIYKK